MADLRIPAGGATPPSPRPTPRSEAARAAQKAFFDAARTNAPAPAATPRPAAPVQRAAPAAPTAVQAPAQTQAAAGASAPPDPTRRLPRPGSILDIKV